MSKIISEHADPFEARGQADLLTRQTGIRHEVTAGINECYAVRKAPALRDDDVPLYIDRHIPMSEITGALKAFGFSVSYDCGQLCVNYAKPLRLQDIEDDARGMGEKTRREFLENGWEP